MNPRHSHHQKSYRQHQPQQPKTLKTLDRVLSKAGVASRTEARQWILEGRLAVNGRVVRDPEHWVDLQRDRIRLDGKPVRAGKKVHLLLYKPKGYLTTFKDPEGRPTVYDLLKDRQQWVFPVGRLDQDTSGLLVITNDADLAEHLTNPEHKVPKTYLVKCSIPLTDQMLDQLRHGIALNDGVTRPSRVHRVRDNTKRTVFEITITEGRNRQVRRMVEALGGKVLKLVRIAIGPIRIGSLQIGQYRTLLPEEIVSLRSTGR